MKKSKTIYLFNIIVFIFLLVYSLNYSYESKYKNESEITGIIVSKKIKENNVTLIIKEREKVQANCYDCVVDYKIGDIVKLKGYFKEVKGNTNFNLFNYKNYLLSKGIYKNFIFESLTFIKSSNNIIHKTYNILEKRIESLKSTVFLKAMILGDTSSFETDTYETYKINGIVHLFAISGMHVVIITSIILGVLNKISKFKKINYFLVFIFLLFYMLIINSASIIRSALMFILCSLNKIFKLKFSSLNILYYIFVINLFINPYIIYNMGFQLSYLISLSLIISNKKISKYKNYLSQTFITSIVSFLASLPLIVNSNFEINLLTPIINLIIIPVVSIIFFPLAILTAIIPALDNILIFLLNGFNELNLILNNFALIINIPRMNIIIMIIYYIFFLMFILNDKHIIWLIIMIFFLNKKAYFISEPYLTMIDVGQGDSILITYPRNEKNILIDAGGNQNTGKNVIVPYLKSIGVTRIDAMIITHGDSDHTNGAIDVIKELNVKNIYLNSYANSDEEKEIIEVFDNIHYIKGIFELDEHIIIYNYYNSDENNDSLITYFKDYKILLTGDAGIKVEKKLDIKDINILKVGHHGSKTSSDKTFIEQTKPKYSLISVGLNNMYRHPNKEVLENLKDSSVLMTSTSGMVKMNLNNLTYKTCL